MAVQGARCRIRVDKVGEGGGSLMLVSQLFHVAVNTPDLEASRVFDAKAHRHVYG